MYQWRDHLARWHGLDPDTYDLMELLRLHDAAHRRQRMIPHDHTACPRCGDVGGVTLPAGLPAGLGAVQPVGCDTCDRLAHHPLCVTRRDCLCRLDPLVYPIPDPDRDPEGTTR